MAALKSHLAIVLLSVFIAALVSPAVSIKCFQGGVKSATDSRLPTVSGALYSACAKVKVKIDIGGGAFTSVSS